jgi:hypothetical protein
MEKHSGTTRRRRRTYSFHYLSQALTSYRTAAINLFPHEKGHWRTQDCAVSARNLLLVAFLEVYEGWKRRPPDGKGAEQAGNKDVSFVNVIQCS